MGRWATSPMRPDRGRSSSTLAGGPPSRRAIKRRWGPAARDTKFTGRRHPPTVNPSPSKSSAVATGSSSCHHPRRPCFDPELADASTPSATATLYTYGRTAPTLYTYGRTAPSSPCCTIMTGTSASASAQGHEGIAVLLSVSLNLSLCIPIKQTQRSFPSLISAVADPEVYNMYSICYRACVENERPAYLLSWSCSGRRSCSRATASSPTRRATGAALGPSSSTLAPASAPPAPVTS
jgi:hypothetical protein